MTCSAATLNGVETEIVHHSWKKHWLLCLSSKCCRQGRVLSPLEMGSPIVCLEYSNYASIKNICFFQQCSACDFYVSLLHVQLCSLHGICLPPTTFDCVTIRCFEYLPILTWVYGCKFGSQMNLAILWTILLHPHLWGFRCNNYRLLLTFDSNKNDKSAILIVFKRAVKLCKMFLELPSHNNFPLYLRYLSNIYTNHCRTLMLIFTLLTNFLLLSVHSYKNYVPSLHLVILYELNPAL